MRLKLAMDPENDDLLEPPADKTGPFGDLDSDYDDDDRRELISHYANEKYLSKWEEVDDEESQQEQSSTLHVHIPNSSNNDSQKKQTGDSKPGKDHLVAVPFDYDNMSLMSYNSIRDCTPSATPKTAPTVQCYPGQLPQSAYENLQLWKGYGGNIYFDAVRCKSMRINSAKSVNTRKEDRAKRWKSKSCSPLKRKDERQAHTTCIPNTHEEVPLTSVHNLGSLRVRSCREKKCKVINCRHKDTIRPFAGKIAKGFSEKIVKETIQKVQEDYGNSLPKEQPLAVSGGQVRDPVVDPIEKVQQFNTQHGFPALLADSSFFSHHGETKSSRVASGDIDPFIKLPLLGKNGWKHRLNEVGSGVSDEGNKSVNEPKPVFIIPFGAFDDPVDADSDLKRKMDTREKASSKTTADGTDTSLGNTTDVGNHSEGLDSNLNTSSRNNNNFAETASSRGGEGSDGVKREVPSSVSAVHDEKSPRKGIPDFHLKREISNLSLSNYLRAVPTPRSQKHIRLTSTQSTLVPKMSYTKRSRALPTFYMVNNSLHHVQHSEVNQRMIGSQVYGGYYPSTGRKEPAIFYAEISTCKEGNSLVSSSSAQNTNRRTKSSDSHRTSVNSPRLPKHTLVKASYVSRNSFSRQNSERSPRGDGRLSRSENNLLPVTGQQISRFSGVHDR